MGLVAGRRDPHALALLLLWNALGGICWATAIGLLAYFLGNAAGNAIEAFGLYGVVAVLVAIGVFVVAHIRHRRAQADTAEANPTQDTAGEGQPR